MPRESILVVDDEPDLLQYLAIRLQVQGYRVGIAHEAATALAKARDDSPDAIVTDLRLSGMSGLELLRKVRDLNPEIPVIIMTGYGSFRDAVEAIKEGAFDYLAKPIDIDELDLILQRAVERRNLLVENRKLKRQLEGRYRLGGSSPSAPSWRNP